MEFEHSINAAINRLREALCDWADEPRYVETLPRRGYRFIAPVDVGAGQAAPLPKIQSIAVLPLENLSGDKEQEYFADGMTEALITNLGKIRALRVVSRTTAMHFKGTKKTLPEIARELNVDAVVEGSVLRSGNRVRITANLLHAPTDRHLWANTYESELQDVLVMQGEVARAIAEEVRIKLTPDEQVRLTPTRPFNPEAYKAYLMGRYFWNKRTEDGYKKAIAYFEQALEKDPSYAAAWAGLADCYNLLGVYGFLPSKESFPKAKEAATKALQLDETLAEGHSSLGYAKCCYEWDWPGAERELKRALELNPNYATGHHWYSEYLAQMGRHGEAIAEIKRAQQLDPLSLIISAVAGGRFYGARRYDQAVEQLRKTLEMDPNFPYAHWMLGWAYEQKGQYEEAIAEHEKAREGMPGAAFALAALGHAYAAAGKRGKALGILGDLKELRQTAYVSPYTIGVIHDGLGQEDLALEWLERAYEDRDYWLSWLKVDPRLDPLRSDPRFQDLLRRMNFPP